MMGRNGRKTGKLWKTAMTKLHCLKSTVNCRIVFKLSAIVVVRKVEDKCDQ